MYYTELAAAFVRGRLGEFPGLTPEEIIEAGRAAGLRLHKFKRQAELPRVRRSRSRRKVCSTSAAGAGLSSGRCSTRSRGSK
jgi:hypothetical protein